MPNNTNKNANNHHINEKILSNKYGRYEGNIKNVNQNEMELNIIIVIDMKEILKRELKKEN